MVLKESRQRLVFVLIYALCVGCIALRAQVPIEVGSKDRTSALPEGEARNLVIATCTQCHSLGPIVLQRKTAKQWTTTVRDMIARGAQIAPDEIQPICDYLTKSFGPDSAPQRAANDKAETPRGTVSGQGERAAVDQFPQGPAKEIILKSCVDCHGLNRITTKRKDEAGWLASVKDMVRLGANLRADDVTTVVAYLSRNFGKDSAAPSDRSAIASAPRPTDLTALLPDKEGKGLVLATCVQCHNLQSVVGQRKEAEGWKRTVHDMVSRGAQLTWSEADLVARYLAESFPKSSK
jgi:cytochrome c5